MYIDTSLKVGDFVAVKLNTYKEKPLIEKITECNSDETTLTLAWFIGTYSGMWHEWKQKGEVIHEKVPKANVL